MNEMTPTEQWCYEDAVLFDVDTERIISCLVDEGHEIESAIKIVETTQNVKVREKRHERNT